MGGFNELGPEMESYAQPSDLDLTLRTANYFLGDVRYPEHNERMLELHEKFGTRTPGMEMTVAVHDLVDHGLINPDDKETRTRVQSLIYDLWDRVGDNGQLYYALGCALSQSHIEEDVVENWRKAGLAGYSDRPEEEKRQLAAAIHKDDSVRVDERVLKSAGAYELDTSSIREAMQTQNVEGWLNGGVELLDNIANPSPDPKAVWRDCIEALSCYYPALVFFGAKKLATELRGKALEWFNSDKPEYNTARERHQVAVRHFGTIEGIFEEALEEAVEQLEGERQEDLAGGKIPKFKGQLNLATFEEEGRAKTIGSASSKFLSPRYEGKGIKMLPDEIGFRLILPDYLGEVAPMYLGERIKEIISQRYAPGTDDSVSIEIGHPHPNEQAEEDSITKKKESGESSSEYKSYHVVFMAEIDSDTVPFEIQTVTQSQEWKHTLGVASEVLRKTKSQPSHDRLYDMEHIGRRREHLIEKTFAQQLIPSSWIDITKHLPELDSPVNRAYELLETGNSRIMVPGKGLADFIGEKVDTGKLEGDIFLPPSKLNHDDFMWMISRLDPNLENNEQIQNALDILINQELPSRHSGAGQLEEHLLPTALHAATLAANYIRSSDIKNSSQFLSDTVTIALLHDIIEDIEDEDDKQEMEIKIRYMFGDRIADTINALSSPQEILDSHDRRTAYAQQVESDWMATLVKLSDRMQNHLTDLVHLAESEPGDAEIRRIHKYFVKTLTYFSPLFESDKLPYDYRQVYKITMDTAKTIFPDLPYEA